MMVRLCARAQKPAQQWAGPAADDQYNLENATRTYVVTAFVDESIVFVDDQISTGVFLNSGQTAALSVPPGGKVSCRPTAYNNLNNRYPFAAYIQNASNRAQQLIPERFAGHILPFSIERNANATRVTVKALGATTVTLSDETTNTVLATQSLAAGQFAQLVASLPSQDRAYAVRSGSADVLVGTYDDNQDWSPALRSIPGQTLYGFRSQQVNLSGVRENIGSTPYTLRRDNTATAFNQDLNEGQNSGDDYYAANPAHFDNGRSLEGPAMSVTPVNPTDILAIRSTADGNGTEAAPWFMAGDFSDTYFVSGVGQVAWVSCISAIPGNVEIRRIDNDALLASGSLTGNATAQVKHYYATSFTTGNNITVPFKILADVPVGAWADLNNSDETYLIGASRVG
ncbi:MAG: hypothetical protein MJH10_09315 [Epibacterium sp.]|nr:hypothetical protein [Epibacterium sp.]NQX73734.1 hypothetical protein [Epibacterium sp.]